jgi:hypothetical protein
LLLDFPLSLAAIMWEWQRRDPAYIAFASERPAPRATLQDNRICLALNEDSDARIWGCLFAPRPETSAAAAPIFWARDRDPGVLHVSATRVITPSETSFDIRRLAERIAHATDMEGREYLLIGTARSYLRLDVIDGTLCDGPVDLTYHVPGFSAAAPALHSVGLLHSLQHHLCLPLGPSISDRRWHSEIARLQAFDAMQSGASQREIAELVFGRTAVDHGWDGHTDRVRSAVRRLLKNAKALAAGGYRTMLL